MKNVEDIYPLSPLQRSFLAHVLSTPHSQVGFEQSDAVLRGPLDPAAFEATWQRILDRHSILRTAFLSQSLKEPLQVVRKQAVLPFEFQDWRALEAPRQERRLTDYMAQDRRRGFDPARAPLMRVALFRTAENSHTFVWSHHHLLLDGWCKWLVLQEMFHLYNAFAQGQDLDLPAVPPYRRYIAWLKQQDMDRAAAFWHHGFEGFSGEPTPLRVDRLPHGEACSETGYASCSLRLEPAFRKRLLHLGELCGVTLNTIVQGSWALLLERYSGLDEVVFGTTVSGRPADLPQVDSMLGMFINNLPVRVRVTPQEPLAEWLLALQTLLFELRQFDYNSSGQIQQWAGLPSSQRLFDSLVVFQNYPMGDNAKKLPVRDLEMTSFNSRLETTYPLTFLIVPRDELVLEIHYNASMFSAETARRMLGHVQTLLGEMVEHPEKPIGRLEMLSVEERRQVRPENRGARATQEVMPWDRLPGAPGDVAVVEGEASITWQELASRTEDLVERLQALGVGAGVKVGVCLPLSTEWAIAWLAVLRAGGVFVPGAPGQPLGDSVEVLLDESGEVSASERSTAVQTAPASQVDFAAFFRGPYRPRHEVRRGQLAGMIDGLGSVLGNPGKELWILGKSPGDGVLAGAILLALTAGSKLVLAVDCEDANGLTEHLAEARTANDRAPVIAAPATTLANLLAASWQAEDGLRVLITEEPPTRALVGSLLRANASVAWLYGATHTGIWWTYKEIYDAKPECLFLGPPLPGRRLELVDRYGRLVPGGIPGELLIDGTHTGELARYLPPDSLEVLGPANDDGSSEDPEIEAMLRRHPILLGSAVKSLDNTGTGDLRVAYLMTTSESSVDGEEVQEFLAEALPRSLLPSELVELSCLPLTPEGTLNRRTLPRPEEMSSRLRTTTAAPRTALELQVLRLWQELFNDPQLDVRDDFHKLGGSSLHALRLAENLRHHFGRDVPLALLLQGTCVEELAAELARHSAADPSPGLEEIQAGEGGQPLFLIQPRAGAEPGYVDLAFHLGPHRPIYALGTTDLAQKTQTLATVARLHLEAMRGVAPQGPYAVGGTSTGAHVAFEMARQLREDGEAPALVAVLDAPAPDEAPGGWAQNLQDPLPVPVTLLRTETRQGEDPTLGWQELAPVDVHPLPGRSADLLRRPHVRFLAERLAVCSNGEQRDTQ